MTVEELEREGQPHAEGEPAASAEVEEPERTPRNNIREVLGESNKIIPAKESDGIQSGKDVGVDGTEYLQESHFAKDNRHESMPGTAVAMQGGLQSLEKSVLAKGSPTHLTLHGTAVPGTAVAMQSGLQSLEKSVLAKDGQDLSSGSVVPGTAVAMQGGLQSLEKSVLAKDCQGLSSGSAVPGTAVAMQGGLQNLEDSVLAKVGQGLSLAGAVPGTAVAMQGGLQSMEESVLAKVGQGLSSGSAVPGTAVAMQGGLQSLEESVLAKGSQTQRTGTAMATQDKLKSLETSALAMGGQGLSSEDSVPGTAVAMQGRLQSMEESVLAKGGQGLPSGSAVPGTAVAMQGGLQSLEESVLAKGDQTQRTGTAMATQGKLRSLETSVLAKGTEGLTQQSAVPGALAVAGTLKSLEKSVIAKDTHGLKTQSAIPGTAVATQGGLQSLETSVLSKSSEGLTPQSAVPGAVAGLQNLENSILGKEMQGIADGRAGAGVLGNPALAKDNQAMIPGIDVTVRLTSLENSVLAKDCYDTFSGRAATNGQISVGHSATSRNNQAIGSSVQETMAIAGELSSLEDYVLDKGNGIAKEPGVGAARQQLTGFEDMVFRKNAASLTGSVTGLSTGNGSAATSVVPTRASCEDSILANEGLAAATAASQLDRLQGEIQSKLRVSGEGRRRSDTNNLIGVNIDSSMNQGTFSEIELSTQVTRRPKLETQPLNAECPTPDDEFREWHSSNSRAEEGFSYGKPGEGLAEAQPVLEEEDHAFRPTATPESSMQTKRKDQEHVSKFFIWILLVACIVIATVVIVIVVVFVSKDNGEEALISIEPSYAPVGPSSSAPTPYAVSLPEFTLEALADPESSQAKAYHWLRNDPLLHEYSESKRLQRMALATFYYATVGDSWTVNTDWLSYKVDECNWYNKHNVSGDSDPDDPLFYDTESACNEDGNYIELVLTLNDLAGTLPKEISFLTTLMRLDVAEMRVSGTLPTDLGLLTRLRELSLDRNRMTGTIPTEIGMLTNLKILILSANDFTGTLPTELGLLTELRYCNAWYTKVEGTLPSELQYLRDLELFIVEGSDITGTIPSEFGLLSKLTDVGFGDTLLSGTVPVEVFSNNATLFIDLSRLPLMTGTIPTEVGLATNMEAFMTYKGFWTGTIPTELGLLSKMWILWLHEGNFFGTIPTELVNLSKLDWVWFDGNPHLTGSLPPISVKTALRVNKTMLTGEVPSHLCFVEQLFFDCPILCGCDCACTDGGEESFNETGAN